MISPIEQSVRDRNGTGALIDLTAHTAHDVAGGSLDLAREIFADSTGVADGCADAALELLCV
jgi:hypothetical protein